MYSTLSSQLFLVLQPGDLLSLHFKIWPELMQCLFPEEESPSQKTASCDATSTATQILCSIVRSCGEQGFFIAYSFSY